MNRLSDIQQSLFPLVGWRQSYNPQEKLEDDLIESESGLYYQSAHPLLTLENIKSVMPEHYFYKYPQWNHNTQYSIGDIVNKSNKIYEAITENLSKDPHNHPSDWKEYSILSDYLRDETNSAIATVIQKFLTEKVTSKETRNLLERRTFFDGSGRLAATINNKSRLVGFEIMPVRSMGVTTKIEKIGLQFKGGVGTVRIYIFHSDKAEPYRILDLEYTNQNGSFQWFRIDDLYLPYISSSTNSGGSWYMVYDQNSLPLGMEAVFINKDWSLEPCTTCGVTDIQAWREMTKFLRVSPISTPSFEGFSESPTMFDIGRVAYTKTVNYGLNLEVTVGCDLSDFIISQRHLFTNVIQKQVAYNLLRTMAMNPSSRVNRNQANVSRMEILYELDGNTEAKVRTGLGYELSKAYKALNIDTKGIDNVCLSANNGGVKFKTM